MTRIWEIECDSYKTEFKNIEIIRKTTLTFELKLKHDGINEDITGWKIYMTIKKNMEDTDGNAEVDKTITSHTDAVSGVTEIELSSSDTDLSGSHWYSIDYLDDDSNEGVLYWGRVNFVKPVRDARS